MGWSPDSSSENREVYSVDIPLRATSHVFRRGHRMRLNLALADFPRLWPTAQLGEIELVYDPAKPPRLVLPRTPPLPAPSSPKFEPLGPALQFPFQLDTEQTWLVARELISQEASLESKSMTRYQLRTGGTVSYHHEYKARVPAADPAAAEIDIHSSVVVQRPAGNVLVETSSEFTPNTVSIRAEIQRNGAVIFHREWKGERPIR
jgi:hypothetical protein